MRHGLMWLYKWYIERNLFYWITRGLRFVGYPSAFYEGIPAGLELEDISIALDEIGVPRAIRCPGGPWPLAPRQRMNRLACALETLSIEVRMKLYGDPDARS